MTTRDLSEHGNPKALTTLKMNIELASIGRELRTSVENIEAAIKLLDEGNTIPFITRFRKDQTGGLTEDQVLTIKTSVAKLRAIAERKAFIVKSIESQNKLTEKISKQIEAAGTSRELEDIYHPFKPRKQTLATVARQNGLEPLAMDIFEGREPEKDLASRATDFVRVDKNLNSVDDVIAGVGHILAEKFSDNTGLRAELREIISAGKLTTKLVEMEPEPESVKSDDADDAGGSLEDKKESPATENSEGLASADDAAESTDSSQVDAAGFKENESEDEEVVEAAVADAITNQNVGASEVVHLTVESETVAEESNSEQTQEESSDAASETSEGDANTGEVSAVAAAVSNDKPPKRKKKKKKKKKKVEDPYKEYSDFSHALNKMPYHRTLAVNRGEKNGRLKVKIQFDDEKFLNKANASLVSDEHPFKDFLQTCVKDAMNRLVAPSLERELRREITEAAEKHAVQVFARNLKNLLLQSPVRDHRVIAIDPGYKRGCSVAVLESNGQLLENSHIFVVGNEKRIEDSRNKLAELIKKYSITLIAIGNGAACREAEQLVSDMIKDSFADKDLKYAMVNEAGASFYSTSEVGREEFPDLSPAVRSAVSIGRRLIDPLSELVKISPANIGVGLYQHDVRAKHLAESLDDVVQFCVNRVGVDANTASTSLMKYVSGLNQLTARRVLEFRQENGAFKNREELKNVAGFGDATFVQAAGFLRVHGGDQPLDTTGIHPEFYETASKVIERVGGNFEELFPIATAVAENQSTESAAVAAADDSSVESNSAAAATPAENPSETSEQTDGGSTASEQPATNAEQTQELAADSESSPEVSNSETDDSESMKESQSDDSVETAVEAKAEIVTEAAPAVTPPKPVLKLTSEQIKRRKELVRALRDLNAEELAKEFGVGRLLMKDILHSLCRPEYDPRNKINRPVFRSGIIKIDDLKPEMALDAQVVNVVDFGVFVDIGLGTSCLVHVSQLSNHFIQDPHRFYAVGDSLKVWVTEVELEKRRVKLTAVAPKFTRGKSDSKPRARRGKFQKTNNRQPNRSGGKKFNKPRKPKPVKPITDDMLKGSEPMRSFSDLAQFFDKNADKGKKN